MTPEYIDQIKRDIDRARMDIILGEEKDGNEKFTPEAEQFILLACDAASSAARFLTLAKYAVMQKR